MVDGYKAELRARQDMFESLKSRLEDLYMSKDTEDEISSDPVKLEQYNSIFVEMDAALVSYSGTVKAVKLAIEP